MGLCTTKPAGFCGDAAGNVPVEDSAAARAGGQYDAVGSGLLAVRRIRLSERSSVGDPLNLSADFILMSPTGIGNGAKSDAAGPWGGVVTDASGTDRGKYVVPFDIGINDERGGEEVGIDEGLRLLHAVAEGDGCDCCSCCCMISCCSVCAWWSQ